jgi:hypothetical protein
MCHCEPLAGSLDGCFAFVDVGGSVQRSKCQQDLISIYIHAMASEVKRLMSTTGYLNASLIAYTSQTDIYPYATKPLAYANDAATSAIISYL